MAPKPPTLGAPRRSRRAPRSSSQVLGAPDLAPRPPTLGAPRRSRRAPRSSSQVLGAPDLAPRPPTLGAPRRSRRAPRCRPRRSARPAKPGARLDITLLLAHVERLDRLHVGGVQQCQRA